MRNSGKIKSKCLVVMSMEQQCYILLFKGWWHQMACIFLMNMLCMLKWVGCYGMLKTQPRVISPHPPLLNTPISKEMTPPTQGSPYNPLQSPNLNHPIMLSKVISYCNTQPTLPYKTHLITTTSPTTSWLFFYGSGYTAATAEKVYLKTIQVMQQ